MAEEIIQRRKLSAEVRERLLALIRNGELRAGDRLPSERELMNRYGVGRPAVREAMQSLEGDGLIEISHGERARVSTLDPRSMIGRIGESAQHLLQTSPQTLGHLREARLMFELGMVRTAALKSTSKDMERLDAALAAQERAADDVEAFIHTDMAFHTAIAAVSGNAIIVAVSEGMLQWLFDFRREMLRVDGAEKITLAEHRKILQAIRSHEEEGAVAAMTEHLSRSNQRYRDLNA